MKPWIIALGLTVLASSAFAQAQPGTVTFLPDPDGIRTTFVRNPTPTVGPGVAASGAPPSNWVVNGDFAAGLDGWTVDESGGGPFPGGVTAVTEQAQFLEGDSFLISLQQSLVVPGFATTLTFDLILDPGFDVGSNFLPDAFELSLLDPNLLPVVEPWTLGASSCFNMQEDGSVATGPEVTWNGTTATVDLSGVVGGDPVTIFFDFVNADLDTLGGVRIDNVTLSADPPSGSFVRGDANGDLSVETDDVQPIFDFIFSGGAGPLDCTGLEFAEGADANDNESLTIADYLAVRDSVENGGVLPAPVVCDFDPSEDTRGFETLDPTYLVSAGNVTVDPPTGVVDRDVFIPVLVDTPEALTGLTLILDYDDTVLTPFDPGLGEGDPFVSALGSTVVVSAPGLLIFTLWTPASGDMLVDADPGSFQSVGTLQFHLADNVVFPAVNWIPEVDLDGRLWRATLVGSDFADHHPELQVGEGEFPRGDSDGDLALGLVDAIFTLNYLFSMGETPDCLDAADADNDSRLSLADPVFTLLFLFANGPPLPPPYPGCGFDEGPIDLLDCEASPCQP